MNWLVKSAIRHAALSMPGGAQFYRWLTIELLRTQSGMAAKWFRVFPVHIQVLREQFGDDARAQRLWCFDSGATPAAGLAMSIATDPPGLLTDRFDRLSNRYGEVSREILARDGPKLAQLSSAPGGRVEQVLESTSGKQSCAALDEIRMSYSPSHARAAETDWRGQIGCIFSAGMLEHYAPELLEMEVHRMRETLAPHGVLSHVVDHRDHRWHADKRISPLLHLTLSASEFARRFHNPLDYHNRWLKSRYVELIERCGFDVTCRAVITSTGELPPLDRDALAPEFANASTDDLHNLVTHFIAVRR